MYKFEVNQFVATPEGLGLIVHRGFNSVYQEGEYVVKLPAPKGEQSVPQHIAEKFFTAIENVDTTSFKRGFT